MSADSHTQRAFRKGVYVSVVLAAVLALGLSRTHAGQWLEDGTYDARVRFSAQPGKADPRIVIIDVDNASLTGLEEKLGKWPWTRRVWTEVVRYVDSGKPRVIALDIILGGEENEQVDSEFASVMRSSGKVVLGFTFVSTNISREGAGGGPDLPALGKAQSPVPGLGEPMPLDTFEPHLPLFKLADAAAGLGGLFAAVDDDGIVRRVPLQYQWNGKSYDSLAARTVEVAGREAPPLVWHQGRGIFESSYVQRGASRIPLDQEGRMLLFWHGDAQVYPRLPVWQVICSIYRDQCKDAERYYDPDFFRDKIVLLGASANASYDVHAMPFVKGSVAPGFVGHATAIDNLINGVAMRQTPGWLVVLSAVLMVCLGAALQWNFRSIALGVVSLSVVLALYFGASALAFRSAHFVLPVVAPCLGLVASFSGSTLARYVTTGRELRSTRGVLDRYVAPQLVNYVMSNIESFNLSGDKRELTILMSDVRNFTTMTEQAEPMELIALLDEYLAAMTEIIFKHNGIVDKFIGDGILAYWGAFTPQVNHAEEAAQAALEMIERVKELNAKWVAEGKKPIAIGVGVNTGTVIFGNIGKGKKIEFTVIGDAVNLTARLESLNKEFGTSIVISEAMLGRLGQKARVRALGGVKVKGKTVETTVYELQAFDHAGLPQQPAAAPVAAESVS